MRKEAIEWDRGERVGREGERGWAVFWVVMQVVGIVVFQRGLGGMLNDKTELWN
jgi:hypothetical protein